ncbi:MAG: alanine:cation symporter family protein [Oscillospiraceae bacterium]
MCKPLTFTFPTTSWWSFWWGRGSFSPSHPLCPGPLLWEGAPGFRRLLPRGGRQKGGLSSFQALTTAIAAQVGTGNIIGSCSAILVGARCHLLDVGSSLFRCPPFTPRPFWPRRLGWSMRTHRLRRPCLLH